LIISSSVKVWFREAEWWVNFRGISVGTASGERDSTGSIARVLIIEKQSSPRPRPRPSSSTFQFACGPIIPIPGKLPSNSKQHQLFRSPLSKACNSCCIANGRQNQSGPSSTVAVPVCTRAIRQSSNPIPPPTILEDHNPTGREVSFLQLLDSLPLKYRRTTVSKGVTSDHGK
jgi:hypothetical protein